VYSVKTEHALEKKFIVQNGVHRFEKATILYSLFKIRIQINFHDYSGKKSSKYVSRSALAKRSS
jgi:hypothetical protein